MVSRQAQAKGERSCALIVVGNEILSGKVRDSNAYFAACQLRSVGVALKRIVVVADELQTIAQEVRYCAQRWGQPTMMSPLRRWLRLSAASWQYIRSSNKS